MTVQIQTLLFPLILEYNRNQPKMFFHAMRPKKNGHQLLQF